MKYLILIIIYTLGFSTAFTQPPPHGHPPPLSEKAEQKIKALYVAFMTQELNITSDESEKFWPLHAQFDLEMRQVHDNRTGELETEEAFLNVKKKYKEKIIKVLGPERTENFFRKDRAFREKLIERIRKKRMQRGGPQSIEDHGFH